MQLITYLLFNGNCEEAFKFYEKALGGKIEAMMPHAGTPAEAQAPAEWQKKILHARLSVGDQTLMASDAPPGRQEKPQGFSVSINLKEVADGERIFKALSEGGDVRMPFGKTFFSPGFGMFTDRFGIPWMINCEPAAKETARNLFFVVILSEAKNLSSIKIKSEREILRFAQNDKTWFLPRVLVRPIYVTTKPLEPLFPFSSGLRCLSFSEGRRPRPARSFLSRLRILLDTQFPRGVQGACQHIFVGR
jgi:PhnB protein